MFSRIHQASCLYGTEICRCNGPCQRITASAYACRPHPIIVFLPRIETLHHARDNICLRGRLGTRLCRNHSGIHLGGTFTDYNWPRLHRVYSSRAPSNNTTRQEEPKMYVQLKYHTEEPCPATPYITEQEGATVHTYNIGDWYILAWPALPVFVLHCYSRQRQYVSCMQIIT